MSGHRNFLPRVAGIAVVALMHVVVYFIVTRLTLLRPAAAFIEPHLPLDDRIPHLPWTWPGYWFPYALVPLAAAAVVARLDAVGFHRLVGAWIGMIVVGGVIQVVWPAVAPWPSAPGLTQRLYHDSALILPFATLPSMHVAHVALLAMVTGTTIPIASVRWTGAVATALAAIATLTLKEHVMLDAVSGLALAFAAWLYWNRRS